MKTFKILAIVGSIVLAGVIFHSCQKEENKLLMKEKLKAMSAVPYQDCKEQCILPGSGDYYYKDDQATVKWGGPNNDRFTKVVDLRVYNTETSFVFEFKSTHSPQNLFIDGELILSAPQGSEGELFTYSIPLAQGWRACDSISHAVSIDGQGPPVFFPVSYKLVGVCENCVESFSSVDNGDSTYTFTYIPKVDMNAAFLKFTFPQSVIISAPDGWVQPGNGRVRQFTTDLKACVPFVFTFKLVHTDYGQGPLWTSFNVNGELKNK